jgi:hypothetical protein
VAELLQGVDRQTEVLDARHVHRSDEHDLIGLVEGRQQLLGEQGGPVDDRQREGGPQQLEDAAHRLGH